MIYQIMANLFFFGLLWVITISSTFCDSTHSFEPKLQWICIPSGIILTIKTTEPFNGIVNAVGYRENCTSDGHGETNAFIAFNGDHCGIKYENHTGTYWVEIEVSESYARIERDAIFNVTCDNSSMSYDPYFDFSLDLRPSPINNSSTAIDQFKDAENGQSYVLHAFLEPLDDSIKYLNRFRMTSCFAEGDQAAEEFEIIDSNGCSTDLKHISDVEYDNGYARVKLSSINPYLTMVKMTCKFSICDIKETCRQSCERHWYDSALKHVKRFANKIGFNTTDAADDSQEPSSPSTIIDPFINSYDKLDVRRETILQILVPLKAETLPPQSSQSNFFIQKCYKIDFYFYVFEQCCSFDEIHWLYVIIVVGCVILFGLILLNLFQCYRRFKAGMASNSEEGAYWIPATTGIHGLQGDEPLVRENSVLRQISERRRPNENSEEAYESRFSARPLNICTTYV